jgi:hypothetical protein
MATINQRISELIGTEYETIPALSKYDLINAAVNEVADMLPTEILLKYNATITEVTSDAGMDNTEEKKVVLVTREVASSGTQTRECKAVPNHEFDRALDTNSIYLATNESPVYAYDNSAAGDPKLKIAPAPTALQKGFVYHFDYKTGDTGAGSNIAGFPDSVLQAVVYKACVNLLHAYVSDFTQDEEDTELVQMIQAQIQMLNAQFANEMKRFMEQDATPRGE